MRHLRNSMIPGGEPGTEETDDNYGLGKRI